MRRQPVAKWAIAISFAVSNLTANLWADGPPGPHRPQSKMIIYQAPTQGPASVGVLGQVAHPGTYQFPAAPTLQQVIQAADGLAPTASPMIRIVRGDRVAQRVSITTGGQEKLQAGDLIVVDAQATRDPAQAAGNRAAQPEGVQLGLIGVVDRPLVVKVHASRAHPETIIEMLGQTGVSMRIIPPPNLTHTPGPLLPDGSVLVFDPRRIQVGELPEDLPKVVLCSLPEPDIGGYGVHRAIEEQPGDSSFEAGSAQGAIPWNSSPQPDGLSAVPLPAPDANVMPTPLPDDDRISATFSSTGRPTTPISRVPFSSQQPAQTHSVRMSESTPGDTSGQAADTREPAWNKVAASAVEPGSTVDAEFDAETSTRSGGFAIWQIVSILMSAGLIVGLALALRTGQMKSPAESRTNTSERRTMHAATTASSSGGLRDQYRIESQSSIPTPHIPLQSFAHAAPQASQKLQPRIHAETSEDRQRAFQKLLKHELPIISEPLALRPGLKISLHNEPQIPQHRVDLPSAVLPAPHRARSSAPQTAAAVAQGERRIIDQPHANRIPGPHLRTGVEAPLERALRHLQGGVS